MRKLENEEISKLENGVNTNNAKNTDSATKENGRVGQVRGGIGGFGRERKSSEEGRKDFW